MVKHDNPFVKFADDDLFEEVQNSYEQQLINKGLIKVEAEEKKEEEVKKAELNDKEIQLVFKEWMIQNEPEDEETTELYAKEAMRLKSKGSKQ